MPWSGQRFLIELRAPFKIAAKREVGARQLQSRVRWPSHSWLRGIAGNKVRLYFRSQSRRNQALRRFRDEVTALIEEDLARVASERAERIERLLQCIAKLPERLRRVGLEGHKPAELAMTLSTTIAVIYNLHYRAHQLLRECLVLL